jgi:hypothetical protein
MSSSDEEIITEDDDLWRLSSPGPVETSLPLPSDDDVEEKRNSFNISPMEKKQQAPVARLSSSTDPHPFDLPEESQEASSSHLAEDDPSLSYDNVENQLLIYNNAVSTFHELIDNRPSTDNRWIGIAKDRFNSQCTLNNQDIGKAIENLHKLIDYVKRCTNSSDNASAILSGAKPLEDIFPSSPTTTDSSSFSQQAYQERTNVCEINCLII